MIPAIRNLVPFAMRAEARRTVRRIHNALQIPKPSQKRVHNPQDYAYQLVEHSSKLLREVPQEYVTLQKNKVRNLELGCACLDKLLLEPGDIFSFCDLVGRATTRRGFVNGLEMHEGQLMGAPGGGLCQLANLIFWMALHLDLEILERHRHGLDLFPDDQRSVPFGMGATVFYNYRDLRFRNTLSQSLLLRLAVRSPQLWGAVYSNRPLPYSVEIFENSQRFIKDAKGMVWRENWVSKRITYRDGRSPVTKEIAHNRGRVCYAVDDEKIESRGSS